MNRSTLLLPGLSLVLLGLAACSAPASTETAAAPLVAMQPDSDLLARGEYLVRIGGCNDCHTPGYPESGGMTPKVQWLVGNPLGWNGPWGTTYPANLRLKAQEMDEAGWLKYTAELHTRPPMPDFAVRGMSETDRQAIYRLLRELGPAGAKAPAYLPPGQQPAPPYVQWVLPPAPAGAAAAPPAG